MITATNDAGSTQHTFTLTVTATPVVTHTITASAGNGGSISPSGAVSVNDGESKTFTITPNSGYSISYITVDGVNQGTGTTYTFINVTSDHTILAAFTRNGGGSTGNGSHTPSTPSVPITGGEKGWSGVEKEISKTPEGGKIKIQIMIQRLFPSPRLTR